MKTSPLIAAPLLLASLCAPAAAGPLKLGPDAFKPSMPPPGYAKIQQACRTRKLKDLKAHGRGAPLGGTRFVAAVSSRRKQVVQLVVLDGAGGKWKVLHRLTLPLEPETRGSNPSSAGLCPPDESKIAAVAFVSDHDADGKPEALVRYMFCWVVPAIGATSVRRMALINLHGKPTVALNFELEYDALPTAMGASKGRAKFKDLDGDGHPDVIVRYKDAVPEGDKLKWKKGTTRKFFWVKGADRYREARNKKQKNKK